MKRRFVCVKRLLMVRISGDGQRRNNAALIYTVRFQS